MARYLVLSIYYPFECLLFTVAALKGSISECKLKDQNTKTPYINSLIVKIPFDDFRRDIIQSPTKSLSFTKIRANITTEESRLTTQNQPA
jgi:hypothetical protein